jgi:hypothetical protein
MKIVKLIFVSYHLGFCGPLFMTAGDSATNTGDNPTEVGLLNWLGGEGEVFNC